VVCPEITGFSRLFSSVDRNFDIRNKQAYTLLWGELSKQGNQKTYPDSGGGKQLDGRNGCVALFPRMIARGQRR
jgi:hypothetical protein